MSNVRDSTCMNLHKLRSWHPASALRRAVRARVPEWRRAGWFNRRGVLISLRFSLVFWRRPRERPLMWLHNLRAGAVGR